MTVDIRITSETKDRIRLDNYTSLTSNPKENVLCGIMVATCSSTEPLSAKNFLLVYNWFVTTLYKGINVNLDIHPSLKDSELYQEARFLKGDDLLGLSNRESCLRVADLISNGNKEFGQELDAEYSKYEAVLLLSSFFPGSVI